MKIAKSIKKHLDTISGKRRITILNSFLKETYSSQTTELRNITGEYSPKMLIEQLNLIVAYGKNLCANQGKGLSRYYSYTRMQEIESALATLATEFEGVDSKTSKNTLRGLIPSVAGSLEVLKSLFGPFTDMKFDDAVENLTKQIAEYSDDLQNIKNSAEEVHKQVGSIQKHFDKAEEAGKNFETLVKDIKGLEKQLEGQIETTNQVNERTKTVAKHIDKLQRTFETKLETLDALENDMIDMRSRIEEEYKASIEKSKDLEVVAVRMEQAQNQTKNIINQARHALNVSQGVGFLDSYKELYENAARIREMLPWSVSALLSVMFIAFVTTINFSEFLTIMQFPTIGYPDNIMLLAKLAMIPIGLFCFFFSLLQLRKKKAIRDKYHRRFAALETYLKLSEHLPYDSPEQMRTAGQIMRYLEEDFSPIAVRALFNANNQFSSSIPLQ